MCGIFSVLNSNNFDDEKIKQSFSKIKNRGPENSISISSIYNIFLGFHRLSINGLTKLGNQPFIFSGCALICNGEIYNSKELYIIHNLKKSKTGSDCEIIIHLYNKYGIDKTLELLDGVFAFVLVDLSDNTVFVSRDRVGVRPLYECVNSDSYCFSSNMISLTTLNNIDQKSSNYCVQHFEPGTYKQFTLVGNAWKLIKSAKYFSIDNTLLVKHSVGYDINFIKHMIKYSLINAVKKRVNNTERPIACLLSGGLDSSLICSLVSSCSNKTIDTYSIGMKGAEDLKYARIVADYLGTNHTEIILTEEEFLNCIPETIYHIESFDTTTIRASVGNYLIGKKIKELSESKVIFNGDGSDEVTGGYLYIKEAPDSVEFDNECKRLIKNIHKYDVLRSDKSISENGLEPRTPFLDVDFIKTYLNIPLDLRYAPDKQEKYLLREAFRDFLPSEIINRRKEAFSDGVSSLENSWYSIISKHLANQKINDIEPTKHYNQFKFTNKEQHYYYSLFHEYFGDDTKIIDEYWMPKYVEASDASARTLKIYN